ncbi:hypothetical protein DFJ74DRAFT_659948 [Hyaloraphidium curvatum]|nr:hypothetical protein DFJ74DRAFT_659948 [Hyaloraphidium curvatum]
MSDSSVAQHDGLVKVVPTGPSGRGRRPNRAPGDPGGVPCGFELPDGSLCPAVLADASSRVRHIRTHTKERPFVCHYELKDGTKCQKAFTQSGARDRHMASHTGERRYPCGLKRKDGSDCPKAFSDIGARNTHRLTHTGERPHICGFELEDGTPCQEAFTQSATRNRHILTHTGEKTFVCNFKFDDEGPCIRAFPTKWARENHLRTHTGEKPFVCDFELEDGTKCTAAFADMSARSRHRDSVHTKNLRYLCDICEKAFAYSGNRDKHVAFHLGVKKFFCDYPLPDGSVCGKGWVQKSSLTNHKRIHTGEKPFVCICDLPDGTSCESAFSDPSALRSHIRIHTGERPYICGIIGSDGNQCHVAMSRSSDLTKHRETHLPCEHGSRMSCCTGDERTCGKLLVGRSVPEIHAVVATMYCLLGSRWPEEPDLATDVVVEAMKRTVAAPKSQDFVSGRISPDAVIEVEGRHVAIEFDGTYRHGTDEVREQDEKKTHHLLASGMRVIRFRDKMEKLEVEGAQQFVVDSSKRIQNLMIQVLEALEWTPEPPLDKDKVLARLNVVAKNVDALLRNSGAAVQTSMRKYFAAAKAMAGEGNSKRAER